eukprot:30973-Pelagococcus_subviridis.AAC.21
MDGRGSGGGRVLARRGEERMDRGFGFDRSNEIRAARTRRARIGRSIERTDGRHTRADRRGLDRGLLSLLTPRLVHDRELLHLRRVRRRRRLQIADALRAQDPDVVRVDDVTLRAEHREAGALVEREDLARELLPGRGHAGDDVPDAPVRDAHRVVLSRVGECPARSRARGMCVLFQVSVTRNRWFAVGSPNRTAAFTSSASAPAARDSDSIISAGGSAESSHCSARAR